MSRDEDVFFEAQIEIVRAILADLRYYDNPIAIRDLVDNIVLFVDAFTAPRMKALYQATLKSYVHSADTGVALRFPDVMTELELLGRKDLVPIYQQMFNAVEKKPYNYKAHAKALLDNYLGGEAKKIVGEWLSRFGQPGNNVREEIAGLVTQLTNLSVEGTNECRPKEIFAQARAKGSYAPQSTGFTVLDSHWQGGWKRKKLTMWCAPSKHGKSSAARSFAIENALMHKPTLIQSFEMPKEDILFGILAGMAFVPLEVARNPDKASSREEYDSIMKSEELINRWIRIYDTRCKLGEIEIRTRRTKAEYGAQDTILVELDHVGIIDGNSNAKDDWRELDAMAQGLSDLAKRQDVSMLAFSQVRDDIQKQLELYNRANQVKMRGSAGWYNAADVVVVSCKHNGKMGKTYPPELRNVTVVQTDKFREIGGQQSRVCLRFDGTHGRMLNEEVFD